MGSTISIVSPSETAPKSIWNAFIRATVLRLGNPQRSAARAVLIRLSKLCETASWSSASPGFQSTLEGELFATEHSAESPVVSVSVKASRLCEPDGLGSVLRGPAAPDVSASLLGEQCPLAVSGSLPSLWASLLLRKAAAGCYDGYRCHRGTFSSALVDP